MKPITFEFRYLNDNGQETGFMAKRGSFDGETLRLGKEDIAIIAVLRADKRFDRIILTLLLDTGATTHAAFAVKSKNLWELLQALNKETSARWALLRQEQLDKEGAGQRLRTRLCPYCESTVDLTGFADTPQMYCNYCDTIATVGGTPPKNEPAHALCDSCGYFSRPREFSTFYFYFLPFIYGFRQGKRYVCPGCMRGEAWKMFFLNLPFVLGAPFALIQLCRVYFSDRMGGKSSFAGLDSANVQARKGNLEPAIRSYVEICKNVADYSGVRYNAGLALLAKGDFANATTQFENALALCCNHAPSYNKACACLERSGQAERLIDLRKSWGDDTRTEAQV